MADLQAAHREWTASSQQQRQTRLIELKLKERQLQQEGDDDASSNTKLLGDKQTKINNRLKEREERHRSRVEQGLWKLVIAFITH